MGRRHMIPHAFVIGSANTETVLLVSKGITLGGKLTFSVGAEGIGGSAVNWARWLYAAGMSLDVLCPIGNDEGGRTICEVLTACGATPSLVAYEPPLGSDPDDDVTPHSYIIVTNGSRTVLSSQSATRRHLDDIGNKVRESATRRAFQVAMIGNVPTDQSGPVDTLAILDAIPENVFIFANGRTQFRHPPAMWKGKLNRINCFQFDLNEAKPFADVLNGSGRATLEEALRTFARHKLNVIVTLGRMGAASVFGQIPQLRDTVFLTWPTKPKPPDALLPETQPGAPMDPTGAGDAFGAGFVASIVRDLIRDGTLLQGGARKDIDNAVMRALDTGALLGSWACCGLGGRAICPSECGSIAPWIGQPTAATSIRSMDLAANLLYALDR